MDFPSGENLAPPCSALQGEKIWMVCPVARTHNRAVLSSLAVIKFLPSGEISTLQTSAVCPLNSSGPASTIGVAAEANVGSATGDGSTVGEEPAPMGIEVDAAAGL